MDRRRAATSSSPCVTDDFQGDPELVDVAKEIGAHRHGIGIRPRSEREVDPIAKALDLRMSLHFRDRGARVRSLAGGR